MANCGRCDGTFLVELDDRTLARCPDCWPAELERRRARRQERERIQTREQKRRAGQASGRARRHAARVRRSLNGGDRREWEPGPINRAAFDDRYARTCGLYGWRDDPRGRNTAWTLYAVETRRRLAQGDTYETTNAQTSTALERLGRRRERRTVQYTRRRLELMQLVRYKHMRRSGAARIPGELDSLLVRHLPARRRRVDANCTPRSGAELALRANSSAAPRSVPPAAPADSGPPVAALPPPSGGNDQITQEQGPAPRPSDVEIERRWAELKQMRGWRLTYRDRIALRRPPPQTEDP